ncbi:MAG: hypothetical protein ACFE9R_16125, partial [Candidatus Hermodarchaeota archaeon]
VIYSTHIKKYSDLLEKENKVRQLEAKKAAQEEKFKEEYKVKAKIPEQEKFKRIESQKLKELEDEEFQKEITSLVDNAEKKAREYEINKKKAIKEGRFLEKSPYLEIIEIYTKIRNRVVNKGWNKQALIYANQIKIYQEKLENDIKLRQIEQQKILDQQEFEKLQKTDTLNLQKMQKVQDMSIDRETERFQEDITSEIDKAEKEARDYEVAIKKGEFDRECPYLQIAEIYKKIRDRVIKKGWKTESEVYGNQIKYYQEKYDNDIKLRQIEREKIQKKLEFEKLQKVEEIESDYKFNVEKMMKIQEGSEINQEEEKFERKIDETTDQVEKEAREYELAIKRGEFEKECPYLQIAEVYKSVREKVLKRGWKAESEIYSNQIQVYLEKFERDKRLRELEVEKVKKQEEFEKTLKISKESKTLSLKKYKAVEEQVSEEDILLEKAMNLINFAENEVRSYELSLKKDILDYSSPYEKAIKNYEEAKKLFLNIGWKEEAARLNNTISFYREKKIKDDNLRELEKQKLEIPAKERIAFKVEEISTPITQEFSAIKYEAKKEKETKKAEPIFDMINMAEKKAQDYENSKKEGILNINAPFKEIIDLYQKAQKGFFEIGWVEQADQINNAIRFYTEKDIADQKLRTSEKEKILKEEALVRKIKIETQLAKEAEEELQRQKIQALENKKKQTMEYEMKKEQAFNLMDLAKKELRKDNFDKAIKLYSDSEHIFAEINWPEGIQMVRESVAAIKMKKEKIEREKEIEENKRLEKLKMEEEIQEQIIKAQDFKREQEEQRRKELLELEKEKEREQSISHEAYKLLEEGTLFKDKKKFEQAFEKYTMARDLFNKIDWQHEVSRINNDLMFILKKEMKQAEKIKVMLQKKEEEEKELETLLKEAEERRMELENIRKEEKRKEREKIIQEELDKATNVIKNLKYNKGVFMIKQIIKKLSKKKQEKLIKQLNNQIEVLENASQVPIITLADLELDDNLDAFKQAYEALDDAQISLSENLLMKAISELNEAKFKLKNTKIGKTYIPIITDKVNSYKKELGIEIEPEEEFKVPEFKKDDLRDRISERRA